MTLVENHEGERNYLMLDLKGFQVFDNHCHDLDPDKANLNPEFLVRLFVTGMSDIRKPGDGFSWGERRNWDASPEVRHHFKSMGVVYTMICQLAKVLDCPADLESVTSERNSRTAEDFKAYAKFLYEDAGIVGTVLDSDLSKNDPITSLIPGKLSRVFQMDTLIDKLLDQCESYRELLIKYMETIERAVRQDGYVGVKSHLAEQFGFGVEFVSDDEAESVFSVAKECSRVLKYHDGRAAREPDAYKKLYIAIFISTLCQCQELGIPLHLHSGTTGGLWSGPISNGDPFLLAPFLERPEFLQTKIILLHAGFPWMQHAAMLAYIFPHVWVDMSWATPWNSLRIAELYRDVISVAPLSKIIFGSGGYSTPEIAWLAAKTSKIALSEVLGDAVRTGLMTSKQAQKAGHMILHDNALKMYGL
jgi:predicted TIM-barrel fold metal-dependent hydrolase